MDFTNRNLWVLFEWNGEVYYVTQTLLATWIIMAVLIIFTVIVRLSIRSYKAVPRGFQNVMESIVDLMQGFARSTMGPELEKWAGYFFGVFIFIIVSNYSGLFGLRPPTADLATTGALALLTFVLIHCIGVRRMGRKYWKSYFQPIIFFLPLNIIGEISKPISLAFRLFGNILSGVIIVGLIYNMIPFALRFILPNIVHAYFDLFVGALQAYVFTVLSMTFIVQKASEDL